MKLEIYPIRGDYTIVLAKALVGDPRLKYRKEVEYSSHHGKISPTDRRVLEQLQFQLNLSSEETLEIERGSATYQEHLKRLQKYK